MNKLFLISFSLFFTFMISIVSFAQEKKADMKPKVEKEVKEVKKQVEDKVQKIESSVDDKKPVNTVCPVSGEAIDDPVLTTYNGKTYALCCKTCLKKFNKAPEKYISKLSEDGKSLKKNN